MGLYWFRVFLGKKGAICKMPLKVFLLHKKTIFRVELLKEQALESLPIAEFNRLAKVVTDFVGLDEKN